jgi:LysM repeat protein
MKKSFEYMSTPPKSNEALKKKQASRSKEESKIGEGLTRRDVLKLGGAFGALLVAGRIGSDYLTGNKEADAIIKEIPRAEKDKPAGKDTENAIVTPEQEEIYWEDMESVESIADILDFDNNEPVRLTPEKMEKVKNYWKARYAGTDPMLHKSLVDGYREWGHWRPYTEHRFKSAGIPIRYALLALPESHWKVNARSKAGAVGPYQFMPKTAASLNLKMNRIIDERRDPLKSAEACALVLRELYEASGDWNVALSGYNGGYAWKFIKEAKSKKGPTNYASFLKYLERKLNEIKDPLHTDKRFSKLSHEAKRKIFARKISGFSENLNYPPKFHAIEELIQEGKVYEQQSPIKFKEEKIVQTGVVSEQIEYTVIKNGEKLFQIATKLKIPPQKLYSHNNRYNKNITNLRNLKPGDKIKIPPTKRKGYSSSSLLAEAKKRGKTEKEMRFLNPHILDAQAPLPNGTIIRV